jgi:beta-lactamase superfamily II metal-dependent hydrolase
MKLTIFQADKGDCLLLTSRDGSNLLVDGGMPAAYRDHIAPTLTALAAAGQDLDLVYVSHTDRDHIGGILNLMDDILAWRVYDYQVRSGNPNFPRPGSPRPPNVKAMWYNAFKDQVEDNQGAIEDQLVANLRFANLNPQILSPEVREGFAQAAERAGDLVASVKDGFLLAGRAGPRQLKIPLNAEFGGRLAFVDETPPCFPLGSLSLSVIGPFRRDLEKVRAEWNKWLKANQAVVEEIRAGQTGDLAGISPAELQAAEAMLDEGQQLLSFVLALATELGRRNLVTPPNLASLMLLVEEDSKSVLLTGDGHADDVIAGLNRLGRLDDHGRLHVNVLKVQHHGSEHNVTEKFFQDITADHYIFCANGAHHNPDLEVLNALLDQRLAGEDHRRFKLWFNSSSTLASKPSYQEHMRKVEALVAERALQSRGRLKYRFLNRGSKFRVPV